MEEALTVIRFFSDGLLFASALMTLTDTVLKRRQNSPGLHDDE